MRLCFEGSCDYFNTVFDPDNAPLAFSPIEYDSTSFRSPCDEHPGGEEFKASVLKTETFTFKLFTLC